MADLQIRVQCSHWVTDERATAISIVGNLGKPVSLDESAVSEACAENGAQRKLLYKNAELNMVVGTLSFIHLN